MPRRTREQEEVSEAGKPPSIRILWQVTNVLGTSLLVCVYGVVIAAVFYSMGHSAHSGTCNESIEHAHTGE